MRAESARPSRSREVVGAVCGLVVGLVLALWFAGCGKNPEPVQPPAAQPPGAVTNGAVTHTSRVLVAVEPSAGVATNKGSEVASRVPPEGTLKLSVEGQKRAVAMAAYAEGLRANQHGDMAKAMESFQQAVINDPGLYDLGLKLSDSFNRQGKAEEAKQLLEEINKANPTNSAVLAALAAVRSSRSEYDAARVAAERAIELNPRNHQAHAVLFEIDCRTSSSTNALERMRARAGAENGNGEFWRLCGEASANLLLDKERGASTSMPLPLFMEAVRLATNSTSILNQTANILIVNNQFEEAAELLDRSVKLDAKQNNIRPVRALVYAQVGRTEDAIAVAAGDLSLLNRIGASLLSDRRFEPAIQVLKAALKIQPQSSDILEKLIVASYNSGDVAGTIRYLQAAEKLSPNNSEIQTKLGHLYAMQHNDKVALAHFAKARSLGESPLALSQLAMMATNFAVADKILTTAQADIDASTEVWTQRSRLYAMQSNFTQAASILQDARARFPQNALVTMSQARLAHQMKQYDAATNFLGESLTIAEGNSRIRIQDQIFFEWGIIAEEQNQIEASEQYFRRAIAINPEQHQAMNYLAYSWAQRNTRLEEALDLVEGALRIDADNPAYLDTLGWVYFRLARYGEALERIKQAVALGGEDAEVYDHLGEIYLKLGRFQEALDSFEHAVKLSPGYAGPAAKAEELRRQHGLSSKEPASPTEPPPPALQHKGKP